MTATLMEPATLASLAAGTRAVIVGFAPEDEEAIRKLLALGLAPGDHLHVVATYPACLFELGSASYALDRELAGKVLVAREAQSNS